MSYHGISDKCAGLRPRNVVLNSYLAKRDLSVFEKLKSGLCTSAGFVFKTHLHR